MVVKQAEIHENCFQGDPDSKNAKYYLKNIIKQAVLQTWAILAVREIFMGGLLLPRPFSYEGPDYHGPLPRNLLEFIINWSLILLSDFEINHLEN